MKKVISKTGSISSPEAKTYKLSCYRAGHDLIEHSIKRIDRACKQSRLYQMILRKNCFGTDLSQTVAAIATKTSHRLIVIEKMST